MGLISSLTGPPPFQVELVGWSTVATVVGLAAAGAAIVKTLALSRWLPADGSVRDRMRSLAPVVIVSVVVEAALLLCVLYVGRDDDLAPFVAAWFIVTCAVNGTTVARGLSVPASAWQRLAATGVAWAIYPIAIAIVGITLYDAVMSVFIRLFP